jgi:membrane protease YdiL (CAAX protease family)
MRSTRALLGYLLLVFVGGALVAPWVYWLVQKLAANWPAFESLARHSFPRYVNRCFLALALIGLWPLARWLGLRSLADVGLAGGNDRARQIRLGLLLGLGSLAGAALLTVLSGARRLVFEHTPAVIVEHLIRATTAAVLVGTLEEVVFRGAVFGAMRRDFQWLRALIASSLLFASVHFFETPTPPASVNWNSGLTVLTQMLGGFAQADHLLPGFLNLTLAGGILALAYQRTGTLYFSIALHAGWIFWQKTYGLVTAPLPGANLWLWGTGKLVDGWATTLFLGLTLVWMLKRLPRGERT